MSAVVGVGVAVDDGPVGWVKGGQNNPRLVDFRGLVIGAGLDTNSGVVGGITYSSLDGLARFNNRVAIVAGSSIRD